MIWQPGVRRLEVSTDGTLDDMRIRQSIGTDALTVLVD